METGQALPALVSYLITGTVAHFATGIVLEQADGVQGRDAVITGGVGAGAPHLRLTSSYSVLLHVLNPFGVGRRFRQSTTSFQLPVRIQKIEQVSLTCSERMANSTRSRWKSSSFSHYYRT
jgi:hypothetical protein